VCLDSHKCHCKNGDCTDPDHCNCWRGYQLEHSETNYHRCEPICGEPSNPGGCVNGKCVAPYLCKCDDGFTQGPENNYTCYANLGCNKCIEQEMFCLPICYTSTSVHTEPTSGDDDDRVTSNIEEVEETTEQDYDYDQDVLQSKPVEPNDNKIYWYIIIAAIIITLFGILLITALKRYHKSIDYDIGKREHSPNNVYFTPKHDEVKMEL